jgi:hypothetical protein
MWQRLWPKNYCHQLVHQASVDACLDGGMESQDPKTCLNLGLYIGSAENKDIIF